MHAHARAHTHTHTQAARLTPFDALQRSVLGGVLDGGIFGSRHPRVWTAALIYWLTMLHEDVDKNLAQSAQNM